MVYVLIVCLVLFILLCIGWIKNEITYKIQCKYIEEISDSIVNKDGALSWSDLPNYHKTFWNIFIWKYKPLKAELEKESK